MATESSNSTTKKKYQIFVIMFFETKIYLNKKKFFLSITKFLKLLKILWLVYIINFENF